MRFPPLLSLLMLSSALSAAELNELTWLTGCWSLNRGPLVIEEHWSKPAGGHLIGYSRTTKGGKAAFWEFLTIVTAPDGRVTYNPRLSNNQPPVAFALIKQTPEEIVFENLAHDFPQRIIYRRSGDGKTLHARIEGDVKGKLRSEEFSYQRAACE